MRRHHTTTNRLIGLLLAGSVGLTACGDDGETGGVFAVEMSDFAFDELPDEVGAGTGIEVSNSSDAELHEFVAYRLDDGTLAEPGRYLILCAIPTGADADEYLAAAATSDGPPQVDGGPAHFAHGMFAEITVTG